MIAGVSALSFVLVMARLTGLARAQAILARRESALREFGGRLVAATELNDVLDAAVVAVEAMIGESARACLLVEVGGSTERVNRERTDRLSRTPRSGSPRGPVGAHRSPVH